MCTDQKKCVQKMEIRHSISFFLQKVYSRTGKERGQIRLRIRWNGNTYQANNGYTIQPERWENGRCKRNAFNSRGVSASDINRHLGFCFGSLNLLVFRVFPTYAQFATENRLRLDFLATEGAFKVCAADYGSDFSASTR